MIWTNTLSRAAGLAQPADAAGAARAQAELGLQQKRGGLLTEAMASYERALALDASQADVWVNLGRARREAGHLEAALHAFRRALALEPAAGIWSMFSNALREARRYEQALRAARTALGRDAWLGEAHLNEGAALHLQGHVAAAALSYVVAALSPATRERALANLALALPALPPDRSPDSAAAEAADACGARVRGWLAAPESAAELFALAELAQRQGRTAAAIVCLEHALARRPSSNAYLALARLLWEAGWRDKAEATLLLALETDAANVAAVRLFGAWFCTGEYRPSARGLALFERCPDDAVALAKLGGVAQRLGQPVRAADLYRRLALLRPDVVESHLYLGTALTEQGRHREASQAFTRALELDPQRWDVASSLLFCLHLDPELDARALFELHRSFGRQLAASLPPVPPLPAPGRTHATPGGDRRLRIGYVSPDLCAHPLSYFLEPVLRAHDRSQFELRLYSDVPRPDAVTARLSRLVSELVPCRGWSHDRLSERIRADQIDILVDLAGHTAGNRLPVFARRPSPVQVAWLGYFDTTGVDAIDYRIADACSVPNGAEQLFVERVVRLPRSANCYLPPAAPEPAPPPCLELGHVSFGCFNNPAKIGRQVCSLYARLLHEVPRSQLRFKYRSFQDPELRRRYLDWFAADGIAAERLCFEGSSAVPEFLAAFSQLDIALDPFPYSGETTALHTLWMGVPLVTLEGPTPVQRLGSRVLRICGLDAWVATSQQEYLGVARALASDPAQLARWRSELRGKLLGSPLLDHAGVTRELEATYRWMWRGGGPESFCLSARARSPFAADRSLA